MQICRKTTIRISQPKIDRLVSEVGLISVLSPSDELMPKANSSPKTSIIDINVENGFL